MIKDTGGPAFPPMRDPNTHVFGMTLRDYFAAKAMQALIPIFDEHPDFDLGKRAYNTADCMLKARES